MVRLFHVSDLHFGAADDEALRWFADTVKKERPDAVICTGDLTMRARKREFAAARRYLESLPAPVTVEPGNHDLPYFNLFERFVRPYRRFGRMRDMVERPLDLGPVAIIPLKTTARFQLRYNWSWGVVDKKSIRHALKLLDAADEEELKLVAAHHPLIDKGKGGGGGRTLRGEKALKKLAAAGADAVLTGHVHDPFDIAHEVAGRTIRLIGAGTLSERTRETRPSFNELRVEDGRLDVRVRKMG
ncbi:MAG: metallophosphoesterase family protein [Sphingomonadaceae bacterium]